MIDTYLSDKAEELSPPLLVVLQPHLYQDWRDCALRLISLGDTSADHVLGDRVKVLRLHTLPAEGLHGPW